MMDIVTSTQSGDVIMEPRETLTVREDTDAGTNGGAAKSQESHAKTIAVLNDATLEQISTPVTGRRGRGRKQTSPQATAKRVTIEVPADLQADGPLHSPRGPQASETARISQTTRQTPSNQKQLMIPSKLDLC